MTKAFQYIFSGIIGAMLLSPLALAALVQYSPGALLQPNDVTSSHIRDGVIIDVDVSGSARIGGTKVAPGGAGGNILYSASYQIGTSSLLIFATSTNTLTVTGSLSVSATSTLSGVAYNFPDADGSAGTVLKTDGAGQLSWGTSAASQVVSSLTAGQALSAGNALVVASTTGTEISNFTVDTTNTDNFNVGNETGATRWAQKINEATATSIAKIDFRASKTGAPADNLEVAIQADASGSPSGTDLASASVAAADISAGEATETVTLSASVDIAANTDYWIVFRRSTGIDAANYFTIWGVQSGSVYAGGSAASYNGSAWTPGANYDLYLTLYNMTVVGRVYKADADIFPLTGNFIGFASGAGTAGGSVSIVTDGVVTGLSGLTTGAIYYLSGTAGALSATPGTNSKKAGGALSATTLHVQASW